MLKILQAWLQQYVNHELPDVQAGFRKGRRPGIKSPTSAGSLKKQENSRKTSIFALLTMPKTLTVLTVWITTNCVKFWKRWEYQTTWLASWETYMQVRKPVRTGHGTDWFQIGKGERAQIKAHQVSDAIQPSHPLFSPSPPTFNHPQHQGLFHWVILSHQVAKELELQLQHQSFQWIFRTDFL